MVNKRYTKGTAFLPKIGYKMVNFVRVAPIAIVVDAGMDDPPALLKSKRKYPISSSLSYIINNIWKLTYRTSSLNYYC